MSIIEISAPGEAPAEFSALTDREIRRLGLCVVESPNVVRRALEGGLEPVALLADRGGLSGVEDLLDGRLADTPIYIGGADTLSAITGFSLTRGVLCLMRRPTGPTLQEVARGAERVCVLHGVCDAVNVGAIFRSAAALGYDAVVVSGGSCDPLNRRSIRVSMGAVFQLPWSVEAEAVPALRELGFTTVCTALTPESTPLDRFAVRTGGKYAVVFGSEGYGLSAGVVGSCDHSVVIPMRAGVDSLNVAAAAAITLWHFRRE